MSKGDELNSDVVTAQILARLDRQDEITASHHAENKETLVEIKTQVKLTNGRVTKLEGWRLFLAGGWAVGMIAVILLGWMIVQAIAVIAALKGH